MSVGLSRYPSVWTFSNLVYPVWSIYPTNDGARPRRGPGLAGVGTPGFGMCKAYKIQCKGGPIPHAALRNGGGGWEGTNMHEKASKRRTAGQIPDRPLGTAREEERAPSTNDG